MVIGGVSVHTSYLRFTVSALYRFMQYAFEQTICYNRLLRFRPGSLVDHLAGDQVNLQVMRATMKQDGDSRNGG
jgi:hypothetical protein